MLTPEEMEQFTAIEQCILTSVPIFVRYLCAPQNEYGDRLMSDAFDAEVLVLDTFFTLKAKGIWQNKSFANEKHVFRYFRKCLKNAVLEPYRREQARCGDPQERQQARLQHINRTRRSRGKEQLPALAEGEQFVMSQRFLTAYIPVEQAYIERPGFKMDLQELEEFVIAQG